MKTTGSMDLSIISITMSSHVSTTSSIVPLARKQSRLTSCVTVSTTISLTVSRVPTSTDRLMDRDSAFNALVAATKVAVSGLTESQIFHLVIFAITCTTDVSVMKHITDMTWMDLTSLGMTVDAVSLSTRTDFGTHQIRLETDAVMRSHKLVIRPASSAPELDRQTNASTALTV